MASVSYNFFDNIPAGDDFQMKHRKPDPKHMQDPELRVAKGTSIECSTMGSDTEAPLKVRFPGAQHTHKVPTSLQADARFLFLSQEYLGEDYPRFTKRKIGGQTVTTGMVIGGRGASERRKCRFVTISKGKVIGAFGSVNGGNDYGVSFVNATQMPEIDLHIKRATANQDKESYNFKVFPEKASVIEQTMYKLAGEEEQNIARDIAADTEGAEELHNFLRTHELAECRIMFKDASVARWTGVDEQDIRVWSALLSRGDQLPLPELAAACLASCDEVRIFFQVYKDQEMSFQDFRSHFSAVWTLCLDYGLFWWYKAQLEQTAFWTLDNVEIDLNWFEPPPWLVTRVLVHTNINGDQFVEPLHWNSFNRVEMYPTDEVANFANRLATVRMQNAGQAALEKLIKRMGHGAYIQTQWRPLTGDNNWFVGVNIYDEESWGDINIRPQRDSRVKFHYRGYVWSGKVCDSWYNTQSGKMNGNDYTFTSIVRGAAHTDFNMDTDGVIRVPPLPLDETQMPTHCVEIEWIHDKKSSDRLLQSVEEIGKDSKRNHGLDTKRLFLHSPPKISTTHVPVESWLDATFGNDSPAHKLSRLAKEWDFDSSQTVALLEAFLADSGVSLVHGPAGTGKSLVLCRILYLMRKIGTQAIACAPTNEAVERLMDTLLSVIGPEYRELDDLGKPDWSIVLVAGDYRGGELAKLLRDRQDSTTDDPQQELVEMELGEAETTSNINIDFAVSDHEEEMEELDDDDTAMKVFFDMVRLGQGGVSPKMRTFILQYKFQLAVDWWRKDENVDHPAHKSAVEYVDWEQRADKEQDGARRQRFFRNARSCEGNLWRHFWKDVRIVLCTSNAAATGTLINAANFSPRMLVSDEAGLTTRTEASIPLAVFKESIVKAVFAGDHKQHNPLVIDKKDNEFISLLSASLFEQLMVQADKGIYSKTILNVQYRTHPMLSAFSNANIYAREQLTDAPSTQVLSPEALTWQSFLASWGAGVYGSTNGLRVGIDVVDSWSERYLKTTSLHNPGEAHCLIALVLASFKHTPPPGGAPIRGRHWMLLSPYWGQTQQLKKLLAKRAAELGKEFCDDNGLFDIAIRTTLSAQGHERDFVGVSFCRARANHPADLSFISNRRQVTVEVTRARFGAVYVGAFGHWTDAIAAGVTPAQAKGYDLMHRLIRDMYISREIVDFADIDDMMHSNVATAMSTFYAKHPTIKVGKRQHNTSGSAVEQQDSGACGKRRRGNRGGSGQWQ